MNRQEQEKIECFKRNEKPGRFPFVRIEELRRDPTLIDTPWEIDDDPRWGRGTVPELALKYFPDRQGQIIDCGAFYGRFIRFLQQHHYEHLHAIDFADLLTTPDRTRVTFRALDVNTEALPYPDNFFDGATAWGFPEHLENPHHFIREVHRTLKDGAIFICSFPNIEHLQTRLVLLKTGEIRNYEAHNNHVMIYPPGVFAKTFLRYFNVVEKTFMRPHLSVPPYRFWKFVSRFLPNNKWFGDHVVYVLRKKSFIPYA
ncbi:class I SAM-dependent methyltransferase [Candidatus Uhrbacteria bacterium]|nr:class I SAM-dependent methyltransferase [Candidatus Uhrbacteria bacterium]